MKDDEANRFSARAARYLAVGAQAGGFAARLAGGKLFGTPATATPWRWPARSAG